MKNITICFVKVASPISLALKQVIGLFSENITYVEEPMFADVIIATEIKDVHSCYTKEQEFAIFSVHPFRKTQPNNVHQFTYGDALFMKFFSDMIEKDFSERTPIDFFSGPFRLENPSAMSILVIDDTPRHQKSAATLLADYDLTIARGYDEAMKLLAGNTYEVVLTDMEMPASDHVSDPVLGELVPYGLLFYAEAAKKGARHVAVVTNLNHHTDPIANAFDYFCRDSIKVENATVKFMHAPMTDMDGERVKDWTAALKRLME